MKDNHLRIRPIEEGDLEQISRLKIEQGDTSNHWRHRFDWQYASNPARREGQPLGWVIETGEGIAGYQMSMPHRIKVFNQEHYVGFSADTYVDSSLRGLGLGVKLFEVYFNAQRGPFALTTTANSASEYIWKKKFGAFPIGDLGHSFLFLYRPGPVLKEALRQWSRYRWTLKRLEPILGKVSDLFLKKSLPHTSPEMICETVRPDEPILDKLWEQHKHEYPITVVRDYTYRTWRYAIAPEPRPSLWLVRDSLTDSYAWFSLRVVVRGIGNVKICQLLDVFGPRRDDKFQKSVLACAVQEGFKTGADCIEFLGLHQTWRSQILPLGCFTRSLPSNLFLCKNMNGADSRNVEDVHNWHLCAADGDLGI